MVILAWSVFAAAASAQTEWVTRPDGSKLLRGKGRPISRSQRLLEPGGDLQEKIDHYARAVDLEPKLVQSMIQVESAFDPWALSRKGAQGLLQLMPATATDLGVEDPFDVDQNLQAGTSYLRNMLDLYNGDLLLALAAYNAGPRAVERYAGVPPFRETRDYLQRVMTLFRGEAPVLPPSGSLRGRPAYLVKVDGRWLLTSDRRAAAAQQTETASPRNRPENEAIEAATN